MKFSKQLCASADLRYLQAYIAYKDLKKAIKLITGEDVECCTVRDVVSNFGGTSALTGSIFRPPESRFQDLLNLELEKINDFSRKKACGILAALDDACSRIVAVRASLLQGCAAVPRDAAADSAALSEGGSAEQSASAGGSPAPQQQHAEDIFHSPAASEHSSSSITGTGKQEIGDSKTPRKDGSSNGACSSAGVSSRISKGDAGGDTTGAAGHASNGSSNECSRSTIIIERSGGGEEGGGLGEGIEADSGRSTLQAKEQQERAFAARLLRAQQQLMELEGILEEQSGEIIFLDSYVRLNFTGFRKITKKYDKHNRSAAASWYMHRVVKQDFMKLNFTLLLARLASSYEALTEATQVYRQQQTYSFDSMLENPRPGGHEGSDRGEYNSSSRKVNTSSSAAASSSSMCGARSSSRSGSRRSSETKGVTPPEKGHSRTPQENGDRYYRQQQVPLQDRELQQHGEETPFRVVLTPAASERWTPLQRAALGGSSSEEQHGAVSCLKYLVPPDMLMRVKVLAIQRYPLLAVHGLPVSLFANKSEAVSGDSMRGTEGGSEIATANAPAAAPAAAVAAPAAAAGTAAASSRPSLAETASGNCRADTTEEKNVEKNSTHSSVLQLQVTPRRRGKNHRTTTLLDAAGGVAARAASWHVYLDSPELSLYTAALTNCRPPWESAEVFGAADQPLLLPRIRWHGQSASLASPLSRIALELCSADESSASPQESVTRICESNLSGKGCPPLTVVLQQRQLQALLRGEVTSSELLQQLLLEESGQERRVLAAAAEDSGAIAAGGGKGAAAARDAGVQTKVAAATSTTGGGGAAARDAAAQATCAATANSAAAATRDAGVVSHHAERRQQMQRVLDFIGAAVQRHHIAPCLRVRLYRTALRSKNGLLSLSLDEDIRFSRELSKPLPPSQWIRSETEALKTDDVQPFPWGLLDVSFLLEQGEAGGAAAVTAIAAAGAPSAAAPTPALQQGGLSNEHPTPAFASNEDLQDFLARLSSLPNVVLVRGFSLFIHGVATLYTERLQEMQAAQQQGRQPQGRQQQQRAPDREAQDGPADAQQQTPERNDPLLPPWLRYTVAMEQQEENELATTFPKETKNAAQDRGDDGSAAATLAAAAWTTAGSKPGTREQPRREAGAGRPGSSKIDVVHKGTSASLVHEWQATVEEEQPTPTKTSFLDRNSQEGAVSAAVSYTAARLARRLEAARSFENLPGSEGRDNSDGASGRSVVRSHFELPPLTLGEAVARPPHQEGLRQPLLLQADRYTAAEQENPSNSNNNRRDRGETEALSTMTWIQKCGRHWLRCCTKKVRACCFPWANRRSARRLQQFRGGGGGGGGAAGAWGGGMDAACAPTAAAVRVEPKTFFANERTLLQWMNTAVLIATIAISLMNFGSPTGRIAGLVMSPVAVFFIGYSFWVYLRRARALERKEPINYNDKLGPTVLVVALMCSLSIVILLNVLYGEEQPHVASENSFSPPESDRQAPRTRNHSKYLSPVVSSPPQDEVDTYDEEDVRDPSEWSPPSTRPSGRPSGSSSKKSLSREATTLYKSAAAALPLYLTAEQRIVQAREAAARATRETSAQDTIQAMISNSRLGSVNLAQRSLYEGTLNAVAGVDHGVSDTESAAPVAGAAHVKPDEARLQPRSKMVKTSTYHGKTPTRKAALRNYYLQQEFEAASHPPVRARH